MPHRLEITLKPDLKDPEGEGLRKKAKDYLGLTLGEVRTIQVLTFDTSLSEEALEDIRVRIFTNPVTQQSTFQPLAGEFDWLIWVGLLPGVKDNAGSTAIEAIESFLEIKLPPGEAVYTSKQYQIKAPRLKKEAIEKIARELLANDLIQQWKVFFQRGLESPTGYRFSHSQGGAASSTYDFTHPERFLGGLAGPQSGKVLGPAGRGFKGNPGLLSETRGQGRAKTGRP